MPTSAYELICIRTGEGIRKHESHRVHEEAMRNLPADLRILRAPGCKLRTFPIVPEHILEVYMNGNNLMELPDLSAFRELIVLELADNSIPALIHPLPPRLASLHLNINALRQVNFDRIPETCTDVRLECNPMPGLDVTAPIAAFHLPAARLVNGNGPETPANPYENGQSVHNSTIQNNTRHNIHYLVDYKHDVPADPDLFKNIHRHYKRWYTFGIGKTPGKILQTFCGHPYSMNGVSMRWLIDRVWLRIRTTEDETLRKTLYDRFNTEVRDGEFFCSNGMMVRLTNVFASFDPNIRMDISKQDAMSARVTATMKHYRTSLNVVEGEETLAFWQAVYKDCVRHLNELEYGVGDDGTNNISSYADWLTPMMTAILDEVATNDALRECRDPDVTDKLVASHVKFLAFLVANGLNGYPWEIAEMMSRFVLLPTAPSTS